MFLKSYAFTVKAEIEIVESPSWLNIEPASSELAFPPNYKQPQLNLQNKTRFCREEVAHIVI